MATCRIGLHVCTCVHYSRFVLCKFFFEFFFDMTLLERQKLRVLVLINVLLCLFQSISPYQYILHSKRLFQVPETPHWLLSKGRTRDAEKALCWLRGWVPKEFVSDEFKGLQRYSARAKSCYNCIENNRDCSHPPPGLSDKFAEFRRKRTLKSFTIVISLFVILQYSGIFILLLIFKTKISL